MNGHFSAAADTKVNTGGENHPKNEGDIFVFSMHMWKLSSERLNNFYKVT